MADNCILDYNFNKNDIALLNYLDKDTNVLRNVFIQVIDNFYIDDEKFYLIYVPHYLKCHIEKWIPKNIDYKEISNYFVTLVDPDELDLPCTILNEIKEKYDG